MPTLLLRLAIVALAACCVLTVEARQARSPIDDITAAEFLKPTRVWTAHLTFTPEQWAAMQPTGGFGGFGGGTFLGPEGGRNGVAARQGVEFTYVHADLTIDDRAFPDVAVRYKGNGTYMRGRGWNKISIKVDLNKHVKGQKLAGLSTINFQNNITDGGWMNEVLAYRLYRDAGVHAPRSSYARVYITIKGQPRRYAGLYSISENVDENFADDRFGTRAGAILKPSTRSPFTSLGNDWASYNQTYDPKTDLTDAQKRRVIEFCQLVTSATDADFKARIGDYVDLDAFARYFAVLVWIANPDSLLQIGQNYYVYLHPETKKLQFIAWDQDGSFGNFRSGQSDGWTIHSPWSGVNPLLSRIWDVEAFRTAYFGYLREFSTTIFLPDRFAAQMAEIAPAIRPAIAEEGAEWLPDFDQIAQGRAGLLPFARGRAQNVRSQLASIK